MKIKSKDWLGWGIAGVLLLGVIITALLTSQGLAAGVRAGIGPISELTLKESLDQSAWDPVIGDLVLGYSLTLDGTEAFKYLDVNTLTAAPLLKDGQYDFYFDHLRVPVDYWAYWAAKGVVAGAEGWQGTMWKIINGEKPIFYLVVSEDGDVFHLVDGLIFQHYGNSVPLRVSQDYPLATYHYGGRVTDINDDETYVNVQMTLTKPAALSLTSVGDVWTIDGCNYLDVYIHLANVHDLYALDVALTFDPNVLEVVDLDPVASGVNIAPIDDWFFAGNWVENEADNSTGTIRYTATQLRDADPVNGAGDIARIRFRAKALAEDTPVTITSVELSDWDGFLIGRPVGWQAPAVEITTTFSAEAGLDLDIIRLNASTVQLQWPRPAANSGVEGYTLHKSKLPYFELGDAGVQEITSGFNETDDPITYDDAVLGDVDDNWFYALQLTCEHDYTSPPSWQVGKFEYRLFETATTDFNWVGYVLKTEPALTTASALADHIESNSNTNVTVLSVSQWNSNGQQFSLFVPDDPGSTFNFPVNLRFPYRVEVDVTGATSTIWAQVGQLPPIEDETYTLHETATTDFNWILQPLDLTGIVLANDLAAHIETNASTAVSIPTIATWNPSAQQFETYFDDDLGSAFATRFGYPYRLEVYVTTGNEALWP